MSFDEKQISELLLERYLAGDLTPRESRQLEQKIRESSTLKAKLEALKDDRKKFLRQHPGASFAHRVAATLASEESKKPDRVQWPWLFQFPSVVGAACLAVVLTYVATAVYDEQPTPPLPRFEPAAEPATEPATESSANATGKSAEAAEVVDRISDEAPVTELRGVKSPAAKRKQVVAAPPAVAKDSVVARTPIPKRPKARMRSGRRRLKKDTTHDAQGSESPLGPNIMQLKSAKRAPLASSVEEQKAPPAAPVAMERVELGEEAEPEGLVDAVTDVAFSFATRGRSLERASADSGEPSRNIIVKFRTARAVHVLLVWHIGRALVSTQPMLKSVVVGPQVGAHRLQTIVPGEAQRKGTLTLLARPQPFAAADVRIVEGETFRVRGESVKGYSMQIAPKQD